MAVSQLNVYNQPLITTTQIIKALQVSIPKLWNIPIYDDFPSDSDVVRFGVYVSDVHTVERNPYQLGVTAGGAIYTAIDQFGVTYVSFQDDPYNVQVNAIIANLVYAAIMEGYHERDFSQELFYGMQAEKHTWTFQLKRLEFQ